MNELHRLVFVPQANLMLARYYSSSLGRFMAVDPGNDTNPEHPQTWNRYAYVRNNPLSNRDPDGRQAEELAAERKLPSGCPAAAAAAAVLANGAAGAVNGAAAGMDPQLSVRVTTPDGNSMSVNLNGRVQTGTTALSTNVGTAGVTAVTSVTPEGGMVTSVSARGPTGIGVTGDTNGRVGVTAGAGAGEATWTESLTVSAVGMVQGAIQGLQDGVQQGVQVMAGAVQSIVDTLKSPKIEPAKRE
jgi:uncharacterized protein RhaS with RHS repeats